MGATTSAKRGESRRGSNASSHLQREAAGVIAIAVSLLLFLSLLSFVPGEATTPATGVASSHQPKNLIGSFGALVGAGFFHLIGGAAYLFPILLARLGIRCFSRNPVNISFRTAASSLAAVCFLSAFLHLEATGVPTVSSGVISRGAAGGVVGQFIGNGLRAVFAGTGAHIVIIAGFLVSLLFTAPLSLGEAARRIRDRGRAWLERAGSRLSERRDQDSKPIGGREEESENRKVAQSPAMIGVGREHVETDEAAETPEPAGGLSGSGGKPAFVSSVVGSERESRVERERSRVSVEPGEYRLPDPAVVLSDPPVSAARVSDEELYAQTEVLSKALASFGIEGRVTDVRPGPVITMYEFEPAPGTKVARIVNLADDLALALKAVSLRIVAPLPGKSVVGIEVPNALRETVSIKEVLMSSAFARARSKLTLALGKDIFGAPVTADLRTMPHLLVAGATGTGKSVGLNTMLLSILFSAKPNEVKLLLIDPKMLEFQSYEGIPHLLRPVMTDAKSAAKGLGWVVGEMERRYKLLAEAGVRNIDAYNRKVAGLHAAVAETPPPSVEQPELPMQFLSEEERLSAGESAIAVGEPGCTQTKPTPPEPLPYIVVMIDELADLMMVAPKEVEDKIARLAQMARASGIHLVLATQRPSVDVLTGLIKANFPARIAFQVSSKTDSRTILDANGAEALLGKGDMLYLASGTGRLVRLHGSFVSDDDVRAVVEFVKQQAAPAYNQELQSLSGDEARAEEEAKDEVYEQAKELVLSTGQASASLLQRRLRVGYPRAARMIERMEAEGIVGAAGRDGRREVLGRRGPVGAVEG
ncbi:MAG: DNA translocase FtsK 4TM domain-containing protein [Nitrospira sp.]|nr:DNA translocase FtsK 4TM domain-containing protein [Nitrospira sp.]MCP9441633.1 DNA translocase FtsK 4TM domain-containing protein [Nitrospira sp.]